MSIFRSVISTSFLYGKRKFSFDVSYVSKRNLFKISLFITGFLFIRLFSYSQSSNLSIEQIVSNFYNTYDVANQNINILFEKRKRQWKVNARKFDGYELVTTGTYLFFDTDSGGLQKLPFKLKTDTQQVDYSQYLDSYDISNYHLHEYFGYDGWYKNVMADYSDNQSLSDSQLYSLARAYSNYASCLLTNQTADAVKSEMFIMPMKRNCMTSEQRTTYKNIQSKAIQCFLRLSRQNRDFETIVGKISIKYANEVMVEFDTYHTYSDSFAAKYLLPDQLYPGSVTDNAQKILNKCPQDAILISYGDNDYYPILYVQQKLRVRRDVHLINQSLIGLDRYIFMASQQQFDSRPIKITIDFLQYQGTTNDFLMMDNIAPAIKFSSVIDTIQRGHKNEYGVLGLPSKEFIITRTSGKTNAINDDTIHFRLSSDYIVKNEWILLDIINNLDGRKLCSPSLPQGNLAPLANYFVENEDDDLFIY